MRSNYLVENEVLEARKAKLLEAALRRQAAIDEEKKMKLEASLHSKSVTSRVTALKPGLSVIENLLVKIDKWAMEKNRLSEIEYAFKEYACQNDSEAITYDQFGLVLAYLGFSVSNKDTRLLLCILDTEQDGALSLDEILGILPASYRTTLKMRNVKAVLKLNTHLSSAFAKCHNVENVYNKTQRLFNTEDTDNDGELSPQEFSMALATLGINLTEELQNLIKLLDKNGDGMINLKVFSDIRSEKRKRQMLQPRYGQSFEEQKPVRM